MEARLVRAALWLGIAFATVAVSQAASYRTANFVIEAPTTELAQEIGKTAEVYRHDLSIEWLGKEMPNWSKPCPISAKVDPKLGAGGATSFVFEHGEVYGWKMEIQGSRERVLDSVLPHEVTHTIFASHFRQPLPRWADEGACTTVEHESEKHKQAVLLINFLQSNRGIAFNQMFAMKEYPKDVIPLYAQGYSLARFLIEQGGRHKFIAYVGDGLKNENWPSITHKHYGFSDLSDLQTQWLEWVKKGCPPLAQPDAPTALAKNDARGTFAAQPGANVIYRSQSPDVSQPPVQPAAHNERPLEPVKLPVTNVTGPNRYAAPPVNIATNAPTNITSNLTDTMPRNEMTKVSPSSGPSALVNNTPTETPTASSGGRYFRQNEIASQPTGVTARRPGQVVFEWSRPQGAE